MMRKTIGLTIAVLAAVAMPAQAHFNMLMPQNPSAKKGEEVVFVYQWGHPYEHQLFDAPPPDAVSVVEPDGKTADLTKSLEKITVPAGEGTTVTAYQFRFTPDQRGDFVFLLRTPPIWMAEDEEFPARQRQGGAARPGAEALGRGLRDRLRADAADAAVRPRTRHGVPGSAPDWRAAKCRPVAVAGVLVEVEHYHPTPPKTIPADEYCTAHRQDRSQRRRHGYADRPRLVVPGCRSGCGDERPRRQELSGSRAQHLLGPRR